MKAHAIYLPLAASVIGNFGEPTIETLVQSGALRQLSLVSEPNGTPSFVICER